VALAAASAPTARAAAPYSPSPVIKSVAYDWNTKVQLAGGSDNWPITWAANGHQYTSWGDGGGFPGGVGSKVELGVARVEGPWDNYTGYDVAWGLTGKSYGILAVNGDEMYMWCRQVNDSSTRHAKLAYSTNNGGSWNWANWEFPLSEDFCTGTFLQFGKDYSGARDGYVYSYFIHSTATGFSITKPGKIDLARVPKGSILNESAYEFFAGLDGSGNPKWVPNASRGQRKPVFEDPDGGVSWVLSVTYNAGLGRYLLTTEHDRWSYKDLNGKIGIHDAPEPWGPWTTVDYATNDGSFPGWTFTFSNKWTSADGKDTTVIYTPGDAWATVRARFELHRGTPPPPPPTRDDVDATIREHKDGTASESDVAAAIKGYREQ
jgi:hypothetical protein